MRNRWLVALVCFVTLACFASSFGCSPQRNARRAEVIATDLNRLPDDIDWVLNLDAPSMLYEDTFRPYPCSKVLAELLS